MKKREQPEATLDVQAEELEPTEVTQVGLDDEGAIRYIDNPYGDTLSRTILYEGRSWEHTSEDSNGVWLYRCFGR